MKCHSINVSALTFPCAFGVEADQLTELLPDGGAVGTHDHASGPRDGHRKTSLDKTRGTSFEIALRRMLFNPPVTAVAGRRSSSSAVAACVDWSVSVQPTALAVPLI